VTQADDAEHEDDPRRQEDAFDDSSCNIADGEDLVLPPRDRIEHDGRTDVRDDEEELQERAQVDLVVLPATGDVTGRIVQHGLEEKHGRDRGEERDDEQHPENPGVPLVVGHTISVRTRRV
jgi:hypothetical protein